MDERILSGSGNCSGFLIGLVIILAFQGESVFSQDVELKIKGVEISKTDVLRDEGENSEMVGYWRHPTRKVWVYIGEEGNAYQCRIAENRESVAWGFVDNNKITWDTFWGTDTISVRNGELHLRGEEKFSLKRVGYISDEVCAMRLNAFYDRPTYLEYYEISPGTGGGMGIGRGVGNGAGSGTGNGVGTGSGGGIGTGSGGSAGSGDHKEKPPVEIVGVNRNITITSKPAAAYTTEARKQGIIGTVRLRVTFLANGTIGAVSVVKGLSYGLTEQAIAAAKNIRFHPALKNGSPYTVTKIVEYTFNIY